MTRNISKAGNQWRVTKHIDGVDNVTYHPTFDAAVIYLDTLNTPTPQIEWRGRTVLMPSNRKSRVVGGLNGLKVSSSGVMKWWVYNTKYFINKKSYTISASCRFHDDFFKEQALSNCIAKRNAKLTELLNRLDAWDTVRLAK